MANVCCKLCNKFELSESSGRATLSFLEKCESERLVVCEDCKGAAFELEAEALNALVDSKQLTVVSTVFSLSTFQFIGTKTEWLPGSAIQLVQRCA